MWEAVLGGSLVLVWALWCIGGSEGTMVVLGSGGHTSEMIPVLQRLGGAKYAPVHLVMADTDTTSKDRVWAALPASVSVTLHRIPRSREVGQSYLSSIASTLQATAAAAGLLFSTRPHTIITNGPGTCLPILALGRLRPGTRLVFIESFCRVTSLSLTGRLVYRWVDLFVVQWPQLVSLYPRASYLGPIW